MVSTVIMAASTIAVMAAIEVPDSVGIAAGVALIILLATTELVRAYGSSRLRLLRRYLLIPIIPLLLLFALVVVTKIIEAI